MKKFFIVSFAVMLLCPAASAQIIKFGLHGGMNDNHYSFRQFALDGVSISPVREGNMGYQVGAVLRISLPLFIQIQPELNYQSQDYSIFVSGSSVVDKKLEINHSTLRVPVTFGFNIGALRLFAGPVFTLNSSTRSRDGNDWLKIKLNDDDVALVIGGGFEVDKFFMDLRYTTFTSATYTEMFINTKSANVKTLNNELWEVNIGFFF